jgi:hypothetical protein
MVVCTAKKKKAKNPFKMAQNSMSSFLGCNRTSAATDIAAASEAASAAEAVSEAPVASEQRWRLERRAST